MPADTPPPDRLVGYLPVPLFVHDGAMHVENQAILGLSRWADNFGRCDFMIPVEYRAPPPGWSPWQPSDADGRVRLHPVPTAYRPDQFLRALPRTLPRIRALVRIPAYRVFAIGGLFGDWGAVSCLVAQRARLSHAVWTDRVESGVIRQEAAEGPFKTRLRKRLTHRPMAALERYVIGRADLGLFNGDQTYDHYAPHARVAVRVNDISIERSDHIDDAALAAKLAGLPDGPLRIVYTGRAHPMKGSADWVATLAALYDRGVDFRATWLGDGPDLPMMRQAVEAAGIADKVDLPGFVDDRACVLRDLRAAHVMLFCHLTPESPRCLIEALASATPIVGYDGAYQRGLIGDDGAGVLCPMRDTQALAQALVTLDRDRAALGDRMVAARAAGSQFDADAVFRHRSEALRTYLTP